MPDFFDPPDLRSLAPCFEGAVPAALATTSHDGVPNVTYLSCVRLVDDERVALSNQFFTKTSQNLSQDPRASLLLVDPTKGARYRLSLHYERTERRGKIFDRLRTDLEFVAALTHQHDIFRLRAADVFRVLDVHVVDPGAPQARPPQGVPRTDEPSEMMRRLADSTQVLNRASDLDSLVGATIRCLVDLGYETCSILLLDETGERLYTIASSGYDREGVGSEVELGVGVVGIAAARCAPMRVGNLHQMRKYSQHVEWRFSGAGATDIPLPTLADVESRLAIPAMSAGQLVGMLVVESRDTVAFDEDDERLLSLVASMVAGSIEVLRNEVRQADSTGAKPARVAAHAPHTARVAVRFFPADGSVFVGSEYVIKGVAGRILWRLLELHSATKRVEFSNRELRLDAALQLPDFRDNFESRLILLRRRLAERDLPIRIEGTGRGRFRLDLSADLELSEQIA